jgi:DNA-binding CsgD family transcriptional regulator
MYRSMTMGFGRPLAGIDDIAEKTFLETGTADLFGMNGLDPSGLGVMVSIGTERTTLTAEELVMFQRLTTHLSSAYRCRRRLQEVSASPLVDSEAILAPDGHVVDAKGPAESKAARETLRDATRSMESVRRRKKSSGEPTAQWRPRINGRWTLVDASDPGGNRLIAARENQTADLGLDSLTEREQQVVASAVAGRATKEIAYDLGVSYATARVLLARAYARLGVKTRKGLLALPSIRMLRGMPVIASES